MGTKLGAAGGFSGAREKCGMGIFSSGGIGYGLFKFEDAVLVFGDCGKVGKKMVLWSAPMEGHIMVRTMPLYWRKEKGHRRLGVMLTSLGKM